MIEDKKFKHDFVIPKRIKKVNIDGKRYYVLPDGVTKLKSVTTVISENKDNSGIFKWRQRVGNVEANKVSRIATSRGTSVHKMAENYLLNEEYITPKLMPGNLESFLPIKKALEQHVDNIKGIELPLYSTYLGAAGTTDLIAEWDGELADIDFKTSKKPKKEDWIEDYFVQTSVYGCMFGGLYGIPVKKAVVVITVDGYEEPQIFVKNIQDYIPKIKQWFR